MSIATSALRHSSTRARHARRLTGLAMAVAMLQAGLAGAASFEVSGENTSAQTLGGGSGQTGLVRENGTLKVGGGTVAVTVSGANATLTNLGSILQTGSGRAIRDNTGVQDLVIVNGSASNAAALIRTQDGDIIQMNRSPASVTLTNWGQMISTNQSEAGNQVIDFNAIASGRNIVNNQAGALMLAYEADTVRPGVNGIVNNAGTIRSVTAKAASSDAIDFQANSGITVNNQSGGLVEGGRHGLTGGPETANVSWVALVNNASGATIGGMDGAGLNFDGFGASQVVTVVNAGSIIGHGVTRDGDAIDIDGLVDITNSGVIRSLNAVAAAGEGRAFSEGISAGGGTIRNTGVIEGLVAAGNTNAVGRGLSLVGNDITSGLNAGRREALYADAHVINGGGGVIRGASDSAIYLGGLAGSGRRVTIENHAGGSLVGGGTSAAVLSASDYDTTVVNAGTIDGRASGLAMDLGAGRNTLVIQGGQASILGDVRGHGNGGSATLRFEVGAGNGFQYGDALIDFDRVQVDSGHIVLSGESRGIGAVALNGGTLELRGDERLGAAGALEVAGGTLRVVGGSQSFASLSLLGSGAFELDSASLTFAALGDIAAGATLAVTQIGAGAYGLRFVGDLTQDAHFLSLVSATTINGHAATFRFVNGVTTVAAVPEPTSVALMLAGIGLLAWRLRRRRLAD